MRINYTMPDSYFSTRAIGNTKEVQMTDEQAVTAALDQWLGGLDSGNLDQMVATCDPDVIVCNQNQPTQVGLDAIREKYAPLIEAATFSSGFDVQNLKLHGDFAVVVGRFTVEMTDKTTGAKRAASGRLALNYRRHADGSWKMLLDIDNNDHTDGAHS